MSVGLLTKWYGMYKLQETLASLQVELARLSADPANRRGRNLVRRLELKMADVLAALQWFEWQNKLDVDCERLERRLEDFDARQLKPVRNHPGQTYMHGVIAPAEGLVSTLSNSGDDDEPETLPSIESVEIYGVGESGLQESVEE